MKVTIHKLKQKNVFRNDRYEKGNLLSDKHLFTKLGKFHRISSLDELPSLINVINADMGLVGLRPLLIEYLDLYTSEQSHRFEVKSGKTD